MSTVYFLANTKASFLRKAGAEGTKENELDLHRRKPKPDGKVCRAVGVKSERFTAEAPDGSQSLTIERACVFKVFYGASRIRFLRSLRFLFS